MEFRNLRLDEAAQIAGRIKKKIHSRFGLTCSIGVGENKIVAKMASDVNKPDGLTVIPRNEFSSFFGNREVRVLWGIGEKTSSKLNSLGIHTIGELSRVPEDSLRKMFGEYGSYLKMTANGIDDTPVIPYFQETEPKSIGHEHTLSSDSRDRRYLLSVLLRLTEQVGRRMRKQGYMCDTVTVKIRYGDFKTITRQRKLGECFERDDILFNTAMSLFDANYSRDGVRLLGISASGLIKKEHVHAISMFPAEIKQDECVKVVDSIRDRFGDDSIIRGASIRN
jgi:DNA polymerase-4